MGLISEYIGFATQDRTVFDLGSLVLLGGPVLIAVLGMVAAYNSVFLIVNGTRRAFALPVKTRHHLAARGGVVAATSPRPVVVTTKSSNTRTVAGTRYAVQGKRPAKVG